MCSAARNCSPRAPSCAQRSPACWPASTRGACGSCRTPRVAVLSTGDELVDDGRPLRPGQIRESNKTMLLPLVAEAGCEAVDLGVVRDDEAALEVVLRDAAANCDAIVTSGGVSMGDYDVVKAVLRASPTCAGCRSRSSRPSRSRSGCSTRASRRARSSACPATRSARWSASSCFARPALRQMMGHIDTRPTQVVAVADDGAATAARRQDPLHAGVRRASATTAGATSRPVGAQGSHQLAATSLANAIAIVPDGDGVEPAARCSRAATMSAAR